MFIDLLRKIGSSLPHVEPYVPDGKNIQLVYEDEEDKENSSYEEDLSDTIGTALFITYKSSKGEISTRRISIKKTENDKIWAYCFEKQALRSFRLDRIIEAVDMATGEVLLENDGLLSELSAPEIEDSKDAKSATKKALQKCRHGLNILVYLARCDGHFHSDEIDILSHYMMSECFETNFDSDYLETRFKRHYPDIDDFFDSIDILEKKDPRTIQIISRYAAQIVQADGIIVQQEATLLTELEQVSKILSQQN